MTYKEFSALLKEAKMLKKEFCSLTGIASSTLYCWNSPRGVPAWASSWIRLYLDVQKYKAIKEICS